MYGPAACSVAFAASSDAASTALLTASPESPARSKACRKARRAEDTEPCVQLVQVYRVQYPLHTCVPGDACDTGRAGTWRSWDTEGHLLGKRSGVFTPGGGASC